MTPTIHMTQLMTNQRRITVPRKRTRVRQHNCRPTRPHHRTTQRLSPRPLRNLRTTTRTGHRLRRDKLNHRTNITPPHHRRQNRLTHIRQNIPHHSIVRTQNNRTHLRQIIPTTRTTPKQHNKKNGEKIPRRGRSNSHAKPLASRGGIGGCRPLSAASGADHHGRHHGRRSGFASGARRSTGAPSFAPPIMSGALMAIPRTMAALACGHPGLWAPASAQNGQASAPASPAILRSASASSWSTPPLATHASPRSPVMPSPPRLSRSERADSRRMARRLDSAPRLPASIPDHGAQTTPANGGDVAWSARVARERIIRRWDTPASAANLVPVVRPSTLPHCFHTAIVES